MNKDTQDFLATLLWVADEDLEECNVSDFSEELVKKVEAFLIAARQQLPDYPEDDRRTFGGNVYLTLSGHGAGMWDDPKTKPYGEKLEAWAGKYRFEGLELYLMLHENGRIDLAFLSEHIAEYREKYFGIPT